MNTRQQPPQLFNLALANSMLPLVHSITADIVETTFRFEQTRDRLDQLNDGRVAERIDDIYGREVSSIERVNDRRSEKIKRCIKELADLGLDSQNVDRGFVDFPGKRNNESVCLCWKLGEAEVKFWHRADEDCSQRQPVDLELIRQSAQSPVSNGV